MSSDGEYPGLFGVPVIESRAARWDAIYRTPDSLIVGEVGHLRHVIACGDILRAMRADVQATLDAFARRVGGQA